MERTVAEKVARHWGYITLCSVLALILGSVTGCFTSRSQPPPPTPLPTPTLSPIRVHVAGAVRHPTVYRLPPGSIVQDAIEAAGGPAPDADLDQINLAVELQDQQRVYVPHQGELHPLPPVSGSEPSESSDPRININTATAAELETLPRIGPTMAGRILAYRDANGPFGTTEDIQNVPGIATATFEGLRDLITVGP